MDFTTNKKSDQTIVFVSSDGGVSFEVKIKSETVWLSLNQIAELFDRDKSVISRHIKNIFKEGELNPRVTVAKNATVQREGDREIKRDIEYFNLDVVLSVGYRVNSKLATQFRIWSSRILKEYLIKGYAVDEKRIRAQAKAFRELKKAIDFIQNKSNFYALKDKTDTLLKTIEELLLGDAKSSGQN